MRWEMVAVSSVQQGYKRSKGKAKDPPQKVAVIGPVPHLPPGCSRRAGGKRPWGVRERGRRGPLTQNVPLGSRVVSQKVNFLGQGNKGGSSRLPLGEERANILLLACCYQEGSNPGRSETRATVPQSGRKSRPKPRTRRLDTYRYERIMPLSPGGLLPDAP